MSFTAKVRVKGGFSARDEEKRGISRAVSLIPRVFLIILQFSSGARTRGHHDEGNILDDRLGAVFSPRLFANKLGRRALYAVASLFLLVSHLFGGTTSLPGLTQTAPIF